MHLTNREKAVRDDNIVLHRVAEGGVTHNDQLDIQGATKKLTAR